LPLFRGVLWFVCRFFMLETVDAPVSLLLEVCQPRTNQCARDAALLSAVLTRMYPSGCLTGSLSHGGRFSNVCSTSSWVSAAQYVSRFMCLRLANFVICASVRYPSMCNAQALLSSLIVSLVTLNTSGLGVG